MIILKFEELKTVGVQGVIAFTDEDITEQLKLLGHVADEDQYFNMDVVIGHLNLGCGLWLLVIDKLSPNKGSRVKEKQLMVIRQELGCDNIKFFPYSAIFDDVIRCAVV